jgi:DNA polymerase (family 10)
MLRIPGLAPEKILKLYRELGIATPEQLEAACRADRLKDLKGFGPALQRRILGGLGLMRQGRGVRLIHHAAELLEQAEAELQGLHPELRRITAAGSLRRCCELVPDLCLVAESPDDAAEPRMVEFGGEIRLHLAGARNYGTVLLFATGSADHLGQLQEFAAGRGLSLAADGIRRGRRRLGSRDEAAVYKGLGLPFIPPELREGSGEIALAEAGRLPALVGAGDLAGVLHAHTDASDGAHTLAEMAEAVRGRGLGYFGVSDHSQSAGYAGGLSVERVLAQQAEADRLNAEYGGDFRILKGIESDILADGSLDYPDDVLRRFDFIVASVHGRFGLDAEAQTQRLVRAVSNPHTTILGHMTGRLLLRREGIPLDIERVLAACAEHDVAVEINGNPHRLDLDWRWHQRALELGCRLSINPDAHSITELGLTRWGVLMARKGGVPKERVLNSLDLPGITAFLAERKSRALRPG